MDSNVLAKLMMDSFKCESLQCSYIDTRFGLHLYRIHIS